MGAVLLEEEVVAEEVVAEAIASSGEIVTHASFAGSIFRDPPI